MFEHGGGLLLGRCCAQELVARALLPILVLLHTSGAALLVEGTRDVVIVKLHCLTRPELAFAADAVTDVDAAAHARMDMAEVK